MYKRSGEEHDNSSQISERCNDSWRETHFLTIELHIYLVKQIWFEKKNR